MKRWKGYLSVADEKQLEAILGPKFVLYDRKGRKEVFDPICIAEETPIANIKKTKWDEIDRN